MLVRITEISRVGRFKNFRAPSVQLGQCTLIYGENTAGKSTLADILHSLETQDSALVISRRTIPPDGHPIRIRLNFAKTGESEQTIEFKDDKWSGPIPNGMSLRVFDEGFLHRNLFTGRAVSRDNKLALTSFVLGTEGVALNDHIAEVKQRADQNRRRLNDLQADAFVGIDDVPGFVSLEVAEPQEDLAQEVELLNERLTDLGRRRRHAEEIAARKTLRQIEWKWAPYGLLARLNEVLTLTMETVHEEARIQMEEHLDAHVRPDPANESWLRQGLSISKPNVCPFCGQKLQATARALLRTYAEVFDGKFRKRQAKAENDLDAIIGDLASDHVSVIFETVERNRLTMEKYPDFRAETRGERVLVAVEDETELLRRHAEHFGRVLRTTATEVAALRDEKLLRPQVPLAPYTSEELIAAYETLLEGVARYNEAVASASSAMSEFKAQNQPEPLDRAKEEVERTLAGVKRKIRRLELAAHCGHYTRLNDSIAADLEEVASLREKLETQQSEFLESYFERLNEYFKRFGSGDFHLGLSRSNRGHRPVISLEVHLANQLVPEAILERVFSESDRRALALAVFWAQVSGLSSSAKQRTIVVLDDHVTSFDEHRIGCVHRTVAEASKDLAQVILIGHYRSSFARFVRTYGQSLSPRLVRLDRHAGETKLSVWSQDALLADEHSRVAGELFDFIDELGPKPAASTLRVFLEEEIQMRFRDQLRREGIDEPRLSKRIEQMATAGILSESLREKLDLWRVNLNPEHHTWTGASLEDQRQTAADFVRFVYYELGPA